VLDARRNQEGVTGLDSVLFLADTDDDVLAREHVLLVFDRVRVTRDRGAGRELEPPHREVRGAVRLVEEDAPGAPRRRRPLRS